MARKMFLYEDREELIANEVDPLLTTKALKNHKSQIVADFVAEVPDFMEGFKGWYYFTKPSDFDMKFFDQLREGTDTLDGAMDMIGRYLQDYPDFTIDDFWYDVIPHLECFWCDESDYLFAKTKDFGNSFVLDGTIVFFDEEEDTFKVGQDYFEWLESIQE